MRHVAAGFCALALACGSGPPGDGTDAGGPAVQDRFCGSQYCLDVYPAATVPDLGAASGVDARDERVYLLGDRDNGVIREYLVSADGALDYTNLEIRTRDRDGPIAPNPSGLSHRLTTTLLGDSTAGVGTIFFLLWDNATDARDLRTAVISRIDDDLGSDPTAPEIVEIGESWFVATADRGTGGNQVRLYDPDALASAAATSEPGVLVASFDVGPDIRSLFFWQRVLVLVQSPASGWQLTFLDLSASLDAGQQVVVDRIDLTYDGQLSDIVEITPGRLLLVADTLLGNVATADLRLDSTRQ